MIVGEASGRVTDSGGVAQRIDPSFPQSFMTGTVGAGTPPTYTGPLPGTGLPAFNIITVRHRPNIGLYLTSKGMHVNKGPNNPLTSEHPGGINVLLADGSVHFVGDSIDLELFKGLATRKRGANLP